MTNMHEVSSIISTALDATQADSLAVTVHHAIQQALTAQNHIVGALEGSNHPEAAALRLDLEEIVAGLGGVANRLMTAQEHGSALIAAWGGTETVPQAPIATAETSPILPMTPAETTEWYDTPEPFYPTADLSNPSLQKRLGGWLGPVFSEEAVGAESSRRILETMERHGLFTVRDIFIAGRRVAFGSMGRVHCKAMEARLRELFPGIPFNNYLSPESAAELASTLDQVPVQAVLTTHRPNPPRHVTMGDIIDPDSGTYDSQGAVRNIRSPEVRAVIESWASAFQEARRRVERRLTQRARRNSG